MTPPHGPGSQPWGSGSGEGIQLIVIAPGDAPLEVAIKSVELCFLCVPSWLLREAKGVKWHDLIRTALGYLEPDFWSRISPSIKTVAFGADVEEVSNREFANGNLPRTIAAVVRSQGAKPGSSFYVRIPQLHFEPPGRPMTIVVGFTFSSGVSKFVVSASTPCIPREA